MTLSGGPRCGRQSSKGTVLCFSISPASHLPHMSLPTPAHIHSQAVISLVCSLAFYVFPRVLPACCSWACAALLSIGRIRNSILSICSFYSSSTAVHTYKLNLILSVFTNFTSKCWDNKQKVMRGFFFF